VDLERQAIERRDFPIARRGYDPVAVDAHLRAIAVEIEELQRSSGGVVGPGMASNAGTHVQSILEAAESAAAEIERQAFDAARQVRESADRDAELTRQEALDKARAHVTAVAQVANVLLDRVGGMDTEVRALVDSLRAGAGRLAGDLAAVETNMAELFDAAAGRTMAPAQPPPSPGDFHAELAGAMAAPPAQQPPPPPSGPPEVEPHAAATPPGPPAAPAPADPGAAAGLEDAGDLDGARLIALNMALNGESRADTERYLQENFKLADQGALIDEVYAAIEG
jgi:hypothetical protein